ncbi:ABC transporter ATP-binding protein [Collinsella sp. AGMB00827]|uniref:ABC transporter ATP-binding protein n=1 Tax=Collinsella ureilytica TaxID=2869515 RepID=A0ABS7MJQ5_9ACTN|nr:ABC transporter ATP-binding protein [Collinsella urealyticum]MBY4797598.1 ABC transporter ATP-binding protein [Collinsella urealyticum]
MTYDAVAVEFEGKRALSGVSLTLAPAEIIGVVGESGCGKSTLLRATLGLLGSAGSIAEGDICFSGRSLPSLSDEEIRQVRGAEIGMVFQDSAASFCPIRTIGDQIVEALAAHGSDTAARARERALELFERLELPDAARIWESYPFELSGGMAQRVGIAMAMLPGPSVILADEPTSALDVVAQRAALDELADLREQFGTSIIFVTHDMGVVRRIADRVVVMHDGGIVETGLVDQVLEHPQHERTQELLAAVPRFSVARIEHAVKGAPSESVLSEGGSTPTEGVGTSYAGMLSESALGESDDATNTGADTSHGGVQNESEDADAPTAGADTPHGGVQSEDPELAASHVQPILAAHHLLRSFAGRETDKLAVNDVSFELAPGEALGIVGESGSGKSTIAQLIMRLVDTTAGTIELEGSDITHLKGRALQKIYQKAQMVFQASTASFNPRRTLRAGIAEPLLNRGRSRKEIKPEVDALLERCGLDPALADRFPHEVSGGQCQRAAIARALAAKPEILVCDELTSALDVTVQRRIMDLLAELKDERGLALIFISHNLALVQEICDRVLVMRAGVVVEEGLVDEVIGAPNDAYTELLVRSVL